MYNEMMNAVKKKLGELFPESEIGSKPLGEGMDKPYFEAGLLETSEKPVNGQRYFRSISMYVNYYQPDEEQPSADYYLVLETLMDELEYISLEDGSLIRGSSRKGKNEGGILNFLVDYHVYIVKTREPEESMEEIKL